MQKLTAAFVLFGLSLVALDAAADPITLDVVKVYGRPARPSVVIEIARPRPGVAITTPTLATIQKRE